MTAALALMAAGSLTAIVAPHRRHWDTAAAVMIVTGLLWIVLGAVVLR